MKEALVFKGPTVKLIDSAVPEPGPDDVVIKVIVGGCNQKDWKMPECGMEGLNQGDDIAGTVHTVGSHVTDFHPGDHVAGFHAVAKPGGGYAEYALTPSHMTFHIPATTSLEEAATVPLTAMTAAVLLYSVLGLPAPWAKPEPAGKTPLVVYGAASAVGAYAVQLAGRSGIHPLICIAGRGGEFVEGLVDRGLGDVVLDYRKGNEHLVEGIRKAVPEGEKLMFAFDAVAGKGSVGNICQVLSREGGKLAMVLPPEEGLVPKGIVARQGQVGVAFDAEKELGFAWSRLFGLGLGDSWLKAHPHEVVPGGLGGIQKALTNLKTRKASAVKYVFRVADTEGISKG